MNTYDNLDLKSDSDEDEYSGTFVNIKAWSNKRKQIKFIYI